MEDKLENSIMGKIKTGQVKIRSKYVFIAEKLGLGTAFTFSVVLSILLFNLILFYLKETDNLKYLSFGKFGLFAFLESFPYLLVVTFIVLIVLSGYLITRSDVSYKKPFGYLAIGLVVFIMLFGGVLTYTNLGRAFEMGARGGGPANMLLHPMMDMRDNGVAGVVFEEGEDYFILQTPQGLRNINLSGLEDIPEIKKGQFVIAVGKKDGFDFKVDKIKMMNGEEVPAIGRGIEFKFKLLDEEDIPSNLFYFDKSEKDCVKKCFDLSKERKGCFKECR